ncbi:MAG: adenosylmethionine decarboxylase [Firmicutes bacterium]|nr:adenosylmethionine decarboxylase [Bacillota bacterium]
MEPQSRHIIAEFSGCSEDILNSADRIREIIVRAVVIAECEVKKVAIQSYKPQGISGVVVLAESHLSIHTWPENGYAAVDIFACGSSAKPEKACDYIAQCLNAGEKYVSVIHRGEIKGEKENSFKHSFETPVTSGL